MLILCTGSQGEPLSALTRIAFNDHPAISVERGDTVIISAKPIPGNELRVHDAINRLARSGAEVLHQENAPVHVSGHGNAEELRTILSLLRPKAVMPVHGEFRMLAAHAQLAREAGVPADRIVLAENGSVVELGPGRCRASSTTSRRASPSWTGSASGTCRTWRCAIGAGSRRTASLSSSPRWPSSNGGVTAPPELIARGFGEPGPLLDELRAEAAEVLEDCLRGDVREIKLLQEHLHDGLGQLVYDRTGRRPMILPVVIEIMSRLRVLATELGGRARGPRRRALDRPAPGRAARCVRGSCARVLPPARALGARRGRAVDAGHRQAALRHAADRAETALAGLEGPLSRYLLELQPERAEGRSWYGEPGAGELREWAPVLYRAGVRACPVRVAQAYLELAVLVRALEGLSDAARIRSTPDRSSLWAGLFDLRENLLGRAVDDLRALAA